MSHFLLIFALTAGAAYPPQSSQPVSELVDRVQAHLDEVRDFEARFTQRYIRRIARKAIEEKGRVAIKKPARMRWDYLTPEKKLSVTDGDKSYFYLPEENQVVVSHSAGIDLGLTPGSPMSLLAGNTRLVDSFTAVLSPTEPRSGGVMLRLTPRSPREDFERVELEVAPEDGQLLRIVVTDSQGDETEFLFEDIEENRGLPDSIFRFVIPTGVEVVMAPKSSSSSVLEPKKP